MVCYLSWTTDITTDQVLLIDSAHKFCSQVLLTGSAHRMAAVYNLALLVVVGVIVQVLAQELERVPKSVVRQCMQKCRKALLSTREGFDLSSLNRTMIRDLRLHQVGCVQKCIEDLPRKQVTRHYTMRSELEISSTSIIIEENRFEDSWQEINVTTEGKESPDCQESGFVFTNATASSPEDMESLLKICMASPNGGILYQIVDKHNETQPLITCSRTPICGTYTHETDSHRFVYYKET